MRCNHCGAQIPDGSRFCDNCGARVEAPAVSTASTTASTSAAKPKKTNWLLTIVIGVVVYFLARGAGTLFGRSMANQLSSSTPRPAVTSSSQSSTSSFTLPEDLITQRTVLKKQDGGHTEYIAVYTGSETGLITKICYVEKYDKYSGITRSDLDNAEYQGQFPSFAQFAFYEEENGDTLCVVTFDKMKETSHMQAMVDKGLLVVPTGTDVSQYSGIDSAEYIQSFRDQYYTDALYTEVGTLHLD